MSLWQSTMIAIARRRLVTRIMQGNPFARSLAYRFVAGDSVSSAVKGPMNSRAGGFWRRLIISGNTSNRRPSLRRTYRRFRMLSDRLSFAST